MNKLVIIGASGHGKVIADIAEKNGYKDIVFFDDNPSVKSCGDYAVLGSCSSVENYKNSDFIVAIGNTKIRRRIQSDLNAAGVNIVTLIHPAATVASHVAIGKGSVVMAGAVINPYVKIGDGCIINTCASVDHDCQIDDYVHVSVGAHIAGEVKVCSDTWIGAGATVSNTLSITNGCMIGAGAVVVKSISESGTYVGVPARKIK